ncbi:hypothetical protein BJX76DRAFT_354795 [Aspergillus varians]
MPRFIKSYTTFPKEIFRINNGPTVRLRPAPSPRRPKGLFDLFTYGGMVKPKALSPTIYEPPNGASMRPNTPNLHRLVNARRGLSTCIYSVPEGAPIPEDLILVHEFKDHWSLQAREEMTVDALDAKITHFLRMEAQCFSKEEWLWQYPGPTETE